MAWVANTTHRDVNFSDFRLPDDGFLEEKADTVHAGA